VWAWGRNRHGQLGDGTNTDRLTPVLVVNLSGVTHIAAGGSHSLALKNDGTVWGWGGNYLGQLGIGTLDDYVDTPVKIDPSSFHSRVVGTAPSGRVSGHYRARPRVLCTREAHLDTTTSVRLLACALDAIRQPEPHA
jgi:alpha-tubulin suppressor-like RCC1 family protein